MLGYLASTWQWDSTAAAEYLSRSLAAAPGNVTTLNGVGVLLNRLGQSELAHGFYLDAAARDPLNPTIALNLALSYRNVGDLDRARQQLARAESLTPNSRRGKLFAAMFAYDEGKFEDAAKLYEHSKPDSFACALIGMGRRDEGLAVATELEANVPVNAYAVASVYACAGERDRAFEWLERAFTDRAQDLRVVRSAAHSSFMQNLYDDPRFRPLLTKVGVSDDDARRAAATLGLDLFPAGQ